MKHLLLLSTFLFLKQFDNSLHAQGCSDAGACSIDAMKPQSETDASKKHQIKTGVNLGKANHNISAVGGYLEYGYSWAEGSGVQLRCTGAALNGNGIKISGVSDLYLTAQQPWNSHLTIFGGVKIPLNKSDKSNANQILPMDYQTSLGTLDIIAGVQGKMEKFFYALSVQSPVQQNKNTFIQSTDSSSIYHAFITTNGFKRKSDILLRIAYPWKLSEAWTFTPGLLPIYHIGNDTYRDATGKDIEINGSGGVTLNANLLLDWNPGANGTVQIALGSPLVVRKTRPEGLTRKFVAQVEYQVRF